MSTQIPSSFIASTETALKIAMAAYEGEKCGICLQDKTDYFWVNPISRTAHTQCVELIKDAEAPLKAIIATHFPSKTNHLHANLAHCFAIEKVISKLGNNTIITFSQTKGLAALKEIFANEGTNAVRQYYYTYCDE